MKQNKIYAMLMIFILLTLSACGNNNSQAEIVNNDIVEVEENSNEEVVETIEYLYEDELNIIDDNYRNYYEIFVYSFCDSDGDGVGDINGLISKLDYINDGDDTTDTDLGFNGIWLMPIMQSTTYHKYDVTDYYSIDLEYGTNEDFEKLAKECDERGIKLIIDLVFNHSSAKHPWFVEAVEYLESLEEGQEPNLEECPYVDYYNFTLENKGDGYHKAGSSDYYYECMFWDQMPDLNLGSEAVRAEIEDIASFWMDLGADGFRLDAAKEFYSGSPEKNAEVLDWFCSYVTNNYSDAYIVGEVWESRTKIAEYYTSGVTSLFNFPISQHDGLITMTARNLPNKTANNFAEKIVRYEEVYAESNPDFIDAPFISNHDTTRVSAQCVNDEDAMKFSAGILLSLSGSPFVYYGEEIGMNSSGGKDENKRLPMNWTSIPTSEMPEAPANADQVVQQFPSLEEQINNPSSIYNYYKRAVRIRNENPIIARGTSEVVEDLTTETLAVLKRTYNEESIYIIYNFNVESELMPKIDGYEICDYLIVGEEIVEETEQGYLMPTKSIMFLKAIN
jgi:glycosidase